MKCLVTGGAGFIGSHLSEALLKREDEVIVIDDLSTGRIGNIRHFLNHPKFTFIHRSILDESTLEEHIRQVDIILHLAAAVGVKLIVEQPVKSIETNIHGTQLVLDLANKHRKKILLTSTSEIYGKSTNSPFKEDDDMVFGPTFKHRWSYACSKAIDEFLALSFYQETALPIVIVRLFNTVGPRQISEYGMVIPRFVEQALTNKSISVYGNGGQIRCFVHVQDVITALLGILDSPETEGEVINVGSTEQVTILELANKILEITRSTSQIVHIPYERVYGKGFEDIGVRVPDISKLYRLTKHENKHTLQSILEEVIQEKKLKLS